LITVQETTSWDLGFEINHKYIMSDDMRIAYGYIKHGDKYPHLFNKPLQIDTRRRTFKVLVRTKDVDNSRRWSIEGSKGNKYTVKLEDGKYSCTCPAATFRGGMCKHIQQIKDSA